MYYLIQVKMNTGLKRKDRVSVEKFTAFSCISP
jgi:hypothetical protein